MLVCRNREQFPVVLVDFARAGENKLSRKLPPGSFGAPEMTFIE
jgi:hypothetical protein